MMRSVLNGSPALENLLEEFAGRLEAGETVDVEAFAAAHPEHADQLRRVLPTMLVLAELGRSGSAGGAAPLSAGTDAGPAAGVLGDFRIVREVGRGGMGVVYEAEQVSLGRRVALKVLPFAATLGARQVQRFHNEARAAAGLHHTNIVPVYAVGQERGVHYYAMQFIDGRTLADLIAQRRGEVLARVPTAAEQEAAAASGSTLPPAAQATSAAPRDAAEFRRAAEWGIQAAEALDCAHALGVVHRDVKPANLLVDAAGRLWVTDFGLAQVQSEASLTATGDLVGTLRYMSPEQALAKRVVIDHRTDVYSLGATLYELLTLRPVFGGQDRQELLRQIAFEEPVPPRKVERAVPAELETIVLKAVEKNPADRYATAQELADDLRRYVEDKPIRARRPTLVQRARKWGQRHRAVVRTAAVCLLLTAAVLAGSVGWVLRDQAARRTETEREAGAALEEAAQWQREGRLPEALAAARRAAWVADTGTAGVAFRQRVQARRADLELVADLEEARLQMTAVKEGHFDAELGDRLHTEAFQKAGLDVEGLPAEEVAERIRGSSVPTELAAALDHWALLRLKKQITGRSDASWQHLLRVAQAADGDAWRDRVRQALLRGDQPALVDLAGSQEAWRQPPLTLVALATALRRSGAFESAEALLRQARRQYPGDFWLNHDLGDALMDARPARWEKAILFYTAAAALRPQSPGAHGNLGAALKANGELDEAIAEFQEALRLKNDEPIAHYNLGVVLSMKGRLDEAIAEYREAIRLKIDIPQAHDNLGFHLLDKGRVDEAIAECREAIRLDKNYANAHNNLGMALRSKGTMDEAIAEYRKAIRLKQDFPEAHYNLGNALRDKGRLDEAIKEFQEAIRLKQDFPNAHFNLGNALYHKGRLDEAIAEYQGAIRLKQAFPEAHHKLGDALCKKGRHDEAIAEYRESIRLEKNNPEAHYNLGNTLRTMRRLDEAVAEFRETLRLRKDLAEAHCNLGHVLLQQGRFADGLAALNRGHELGSQNPRWPYPSAQWVRTAEHLVALEGKLPKVLKGEAHPADAAEQLVLAGMCQRLNKKLYAAASRLYADAFDAEPKLAGDLDSQARYNAACAAALAGCGHGQDAPASDGPERGRLRRQALDWLRADLGAYCKLLVTEPDKVRPAVCQRMQHWQQDADLAGVRDPAALAKLPEAERQQWQALWQEVEALRQRAAGPLKPTKPSGP
jgi:tetratricopeptide (TPR) repeat protein